MLQTHLLFAALSILALITYKPLAVITIGLWFAYFVYVCYKIATMPEI
jgi:hypothetical protein